VSNQARTPYVDVCRIEWPPRAEINVTPRIDVLLVLIIIFMTITPLVPKGLNALVPQNSADPAKTRRRPRTS
jgi:biopolymer transport protein ExbD